MLPFSKDCLAVHSSDLDLRMMRTAFTLVELIVVVLILGILAAVVVPRLINNSREARDAAAAQNLARLRDAIDLYRAKYQQLPPGTMTTCDLPAALDEFLQGRRFPDGNRGIDGVKYVTGTPTVQSGPFGWVYSVDEGTIILNSHGQTTLDLGSTYADL